MARASLRLRGVLGCNFSFLGQNCTFLKEFRFIWLFRWMKIIFWEKYPEVTTPHKKAKIFIMRQLLLPFSNKFPLPESWNIMKYSQVWGIFTFSNIICDDEERIQMFFFATCKLLSRGLRPVKQIFWTAPRRHKFSHFIYEKF